MIREPMARLADYLVDLAALLAERQAGFHGASRWPGAMPIPRWCGGYGRLLPLPHRRIHWLRTTHPRFAHPVGVVLKPDRFREWVRPGR